MTPRKLLPGTHKKALQICGRLAPEIMPSAQSSSKTQMCGHVNLQHATCTDKPAVISVPAYPTPLHTHRGFKRIPHFFVFSWNQTQHFMVADLTGEEWVLPAGMLPLAGADRKIGMLLMSSQRKPLMDKRVVVFLPSPFMLPGVFK